MKHFNRRNLKEMKRKGLTIQKQDEVGYGKALILEYNVYYIIVSFIVQR